MLRRLFAWREQQRALDRAHASLRFLDVVHERPEDETPAYQPQLRGEALRAVCACPVIVDGRPHWPTPRRTQDADPEKLKADPVLQLVTTRRPA